MSKINVIYWIFYGILQWNWLTYSKIKIKKINSNSLLYILLKYLDKPLQQQQHYQKKKHIASLIQWYLETRTTLLQTQLLQTDSNLLDK